ncbi:MAG: FecR family protein [Verrucomicrobiae bacterium]|nr:FecR family protein [Verrucomicrobiae bacterium]
MRNSLLIGLGWLLLGQSSALYSATMDYAEISIIQKDVRIKAGTSDRVAKVKDRVTPPEVIVTGANSRAELIFSDKTVARLGQLTVFSFKAGSRDVTLEKGSLLFDVPKGQGKTNIRTAAVTAAITGTTGLIQTDGSGYYACYVYEGSININGQNLVPGQGFTIINGVINVINFDINKAMESSSLFSEFGELPDADKIKAIAEAQKSGSNQGGSGYNGNSPDATLPRNLRIGKDASENQGFGKPNVGT